MDDDFGFGTSIWATSSTDTASLDPLAKSKRPAFSSLATPSTSDDLLDDADAFDDNDDGFDFSASTCIPAASTFVNTVDDDFGDFGDFNNFDDGAGAAGPGSFVQESSFADALPTDDPSLGAKYWTALRLDPIPSTSELKEQVEEILRPLWRRTDASAYMTDEDIRQVGGLNQILVTPESRTLYSTLLQSAPPSTLPPNWTRSRIRRRHLVSLGIPVNLDEVLPTAGAKQLPALQIMTRPMSAPPGPRHLNGSNPRIDRMASPPPGPGSANNSRAGTPVLRASPLGRPVSSASQTQLSLGPKPELDEARIERILAMSPDDLALRPLSTLEAHLESLRSLTASTSAVLAHLLQQRDALQQDSETYNGLIAELVGEAQKMKSGNTKARPNRRTSGMT